jgi:hypothetical protein
MEYDVNKAIRQSARIFDIHSQESELQAQEDVDWNSGDAEPPSEDQFGVNGFDAVPLSSAIDTARLAHVPAFQQIHAAIKDLHAQCVEKSKDEKQTADFRSLNHAKGLGVEQVLGVISAVLEESEARLKSATPAERHAMGKDANQFISDLLAPVSDMKKPIVVGPSSLDETPKPPRVPSVGVQKNTKAAQEFLAKGGK